MNRKEIEKLGRRALALGWPYSLHDERLKRAGKVVKTKDPDTDGYWDWWPDLSDELTELACIPWVEKVWEGVGDVLVCRAKGEVSVYGLDHERIWGARGTSLAHALLDAVDAAQNMIIQIEVEARAQSIGAWMAVLLARRTAEEEDV